MAPIVGAIFAVLTYELIYYGRRNIEIVPVAVPAGSAAAVAGTAVPGSELEAAKHRMPEMDKDMDMRGTAAPAQWGTLKGPLGSGLESEYNNGFEVRPVASVTSMTSPLPSRAVSAAPSITNPSAGLPSPAAEIGGFQVFAPRI